ncbi:MAG: arginase family protein [Barrevirus sp.]|uniref:Arginase family protein n=1 Tax=Barrevirus sp. TaxID=2487763 RepID=A0A3G4ZUN6_9VIRU|nr:MAG: arginase family protein [Barrevirus sp.]
MIIIDLYCTIQFFRKIDNIIVYDSLYYFDIIEIIMNNSYTIHFIKAPICKGIEEGVENVEGDQGCQFAPDKIKEKYDFCCDKSEDLEKHLLNYSKDNPDHKIVTIGGNISVSFSTVLTLKEIHKDDLVILWIGTHPISTLCINDVSFIYFGIPDNCDNMDHIHNNQIPFFTNKKINSLITNKETYQVIPSAIKQIIGLRKVHVVLDMRVFNKDIVKCVSESNIKGYQGITIDSVENMLLMIKTNIVSMDITEFNPKKGTEYDVKICTELIRYLLAKTFDNDIKKNINIFTEDSYFLIYRPIHQVDYETDIGWYILKGLSVEMKEQLLKKIQDDNIITIDIDNLDEDVQDDDNTYLITKTNMKEQNEISYYTAYTICDAALFPQEKALMMFKLLNTL